MSAATEDQQQAVASHQLTERASNSVLIGQHKVRYFLAYSRSSLVAVVLRITELDPILGGYFRSPTGKEATDHAVKNLGLSIYIHVIPYIPNRAANICA